jgi:hypothetical protein
MTKKNLFVLSAIFVSLCSTVIYGQFAGQTVSTTGYVTITAARSGDGDPAPPFPKPPAQMFDAGRKYQGTRLVADGDPAPPFPIPPKTGFEWLHSTIA